VTAESHGGVSRPKFEPEPSGICSRCADEFLTPFLFVMDAQYVSCEVEIELLTII
jgi:hypothetical protein